MTKSIPEKCEQVITTIPLQKMPRNKRKVKKVETPIVEEQPIKRSRAARTLEALSKVEEEEK